MPKPEPRPLRTLPERAFRARAGLVAGVFCLACWWAATSRRRP